nr:hypothetical protein CFP56_32373 [Quercus suber]
MIRDGKNEGWLSLTPDNFLTWAEMNQVDFSATRPGSVVGKGTALLSRHIVKCDDSASELPCLLEVPEHLILSFERVCDHAKIDRDFREVLDSIGEFGRVGQDHIFLPSILILVLLDTKTLRR